MKRFIVMLVITCFFTGLCVVKVQTVLNAVGKGTLINNPVKKDKKENKTKNTKKTKKVKKQKRTNW